jgi:high-affinity Fe2+/Pb2+ permease
MTWYDFLRYSKYIAIFYAIAFALVLIGIWSSIGVGERFIWSGVLFFAAAAAANIALGWYHSNHRSSMALEKNIYLDQQQKAQVITTEGKELAELKTELDLEGRFREIARKTIREERGY